MTVHSLHIFDRKGKTLFTKTYSPVATKQQRYLQESSAAGSEPGNDGSDALTEQRKLVFGMLYSLKETIERLTPDDPGTFGSAPSLESVKTKTTTGHCFETLNGLRFVLYTSNNVLTSAASSTTSSSTLSSVSSPSNPDYSENIYARDVLRHIYSNIWVECVIRSPMYCPTSGFSMSVDKESGSGGDGTDVGKSHFSVSSTNFETELNSYLSSLPWFR
uniref:Trafficking protein particle complex subunit n=1 Tax=Chaetoceros debilis TaxID=122233 RepID=A0A7S3PUX2_9STRA|mmetsp:Transcript_12450/g.18709  ORF Transcript_12450/g.18709 Transcript_12450/m.18709 type:complete len:218 (+) Transcript_12450:112-765(+)|eukprot:CAMPEP_0194086664 /NCGR_PEP_ID=MMETSP0149-20130528/21997_1 /TAXON_ID=122233 /ORGANISM="Chaetoceros debilis, Strain MM31A-1" /LENGTH=217 /DNA_ID=CAMNT_0038769803 /DNA_START=56 /DNA_END=709 /DNA_ORIENTATION=+